MITSKCTCPALAHFEAVRVHPLKQDGSSYSAAIASKATIVETLIGAVVQVNMSRVTGLPTVPIKCGNRLEENHGHGRDERNRAGNQR